MMSRILPVVFLLIAVGLFFGYINPTYTGKVAQLRAEIASYDGALVAAENYNAKKNQLIAERESIPTEGIARIEAFLPDGVDNVQLILDLNALAGRSGLALSNFETNQSPAESDPDRFNLESEEAVESLNISMLATGNYASFKRFLAGTEESLRPLDIVDISIQDSETGIYTYQLTYRIYWLAP